METDNNVNGETDDTYYIPCGQCNQPTTWDTTYGNLCYRCCRADNE